MDAYRDTATPLADLALGALVEASTLDYSARTAVGVSERSDVGRYGRRVGRRGRWAVLGLSGLSFACALPALLVLLVAPVVASDHGATVAQGRWAVVGSEVVVAAAAALLAIALNWSGGRSAGWRHGIGVAAAINAGLVAVVVARLDSRASMVTLGGIGAALVSIGLVLVRPLLVDVATPEVRVRALARWRGAAVLAGAGAAALAALAVGGPAWGWRTSLTTAGGLAAALGILAAFVDDPGVGGFETRRLDRLVAGPSAAPAAPGSVRRALTNGAVVGSFAGYVGVGLAGLASLGATARVVQGHDLSTSETYLGLAGVWLGAAVGTVAVAPLLERLRRASPGRLAAAAPVLLLLSAGGLAAVGEAPTTWGVLTGSGLVVAGAALAAAALDAVALSATEPADRPATSALTGFCVALGAIAGLVWFAVPGHEDLSGWLVTWLAAPVVLCAVLLVGLPGAAVRALDAQVADVGRRAEEAASSAAPDGALAELVLPEVVLPHAGPRHVVLPDAGRTDVAPRSPGHVLVVAGEPGDSTYGGRHRAARDVLERTGEVVVREAGPAPMPTDLRGDPPATARSGYAAGVELLVPLVVGPSARNAGSDGRSSPGVAPEALAPRPVASGAALLEARAVSVAYGSVEVVVDVDLRLQQGESVGLVGPAGVGRAALMRVLAGDGPPSSGQVLLDGEDVSAPPSFPRPPLDLAVIVRGRPLLGSMTVAENLRMYGFTVGQGKSEVDAGTDIAFEVFPDLTERRNDLVSTLSGADRQRVALARSLVARPSVLLVEPDSLWLRPVVATELRPVLARLHADGTGLLLVADASGALALPVDRAYLLARGRVVEQADAAD